AVIVISMLYHEFEKQEMLFVACARQNVDLFIAWDSGMELQRKPSTQQNVSKNTASSNTVGLYISITGPLRWILFQVGIFSDEVLIHDISTITTAFNSPNQFIFVNVSVKSDFAQLISETIISKKCGDIFRRIS
ncbi:9625_t:CDS:2, partial [Acaulospora colombiana]